MNRTDRLLAIVLELQAKGWQRAEDLAARFEISKRTVYRDMQALSESGVPVVSVPGQGYSLVEGYFLPPLTFSADEALILLLGGGFMASNFDAEYRQAAQTAVSKIEAVLSDDLRAEVDYLRRSLRFINPGVAGVPENLLPIRRAIIQRRTLQFDYNARSTDEIGTAKTTRSADPYALINVGNRWYMVAYCHLRHAVRNFRVERIDQIQVLRRAFARPASFDIQMLEARPREVIVKALFDRAVGRWVQEEQAYYLGAAEERPDGLLVTLRVWREDDVLQWLLGWGGYVRVLEPESLRQRLIEAAQALLQRYETG